MPGKHHPPVSQEPTTWEHYVRQPQTFPDVVFRRKTDGQEIVLGIELKGWYLLAKGGMPNFRFTVTPAVCNPWDLIVVVPWALSNVLSGSPTVYSPFIELGHLRLSSVTTTGSTSAKREGTDRL